MAHWRVREHGDVLHLARRDGERTLPIAAMAELASRVGEAAGDERLLVLELDLLHADLSEVRELAGGRQISDFAPWVEATRALHEHPLPTIAAVPRQATAGGCETALACDLRVAAPEARLGLLETRMGIVPGSGGSQRLPRLVGPGHAARLVYGGMAVDGAEAHRIGLVEVLDPDPVRRALELAAAFAANGIAVLAAAKRALAAAASEPLGEGLRAEGRALLSVLAEPLARERLDSWLAGREDPRALGPTGGESKGRRRG